LNFGDDLDCRPFVYDIKKYKSDGDFYRLRNWQRSYLDVEIDFWVKKLFC